MLFLLFYRLKKNVYLSVLYHVLFLPQNASNVFSGRALSRTARELTALSIPKVG